MPDANVCTKYPTQNKYTNCRTAGPKIKPNKEYNSDSEYIRILIMPLKKLYNQYPIK
jgi:hypothetical protein